MTGSRARSIRARLVAVVSLAVTPAIAADPALIPGEHAEAGTPERGRPPGGPPGAAPGASPFDNALRLARMLGDDRTAADLLEQRALAPRAAWSDVTDAVDALEAVGDPERAARLLERRASGAPHDPRALVALAELWTRSGHAVRAVAAWRRLQAAVGDPSADQALALAALLDHAGHPDEALRVLSSARERAPETALEFWDALGTLAWEAGADENARAAYRTLWASGDRRTVVSQRLMVLSSEAGAYDEAVAVGTEGYRRSSDADLLLELASIQMAKEDWSGVVRTLAVAEAARGTLASREDYWLLRAEAHERLRDWPTARSSYEAVLALDPGSVAAKVALLDEAIAQDDRRALRDYTGRWAASSSGEPALWGPLAIALDREGRTREAFAFYARQIRGAHADPMVILDFADALARSGDDLRASRLRRYATGRLRDRLIAAARDVKPDADQRALAESAAEVVRDVSGAEVGERWFRAIGGARGPGDRQSDVFVADWCLHEDRLGCASGVVARRLGRSRTMGADATEESRWRGLGLQIAVAENDHAQMKSLLSGGSGLDPSDRIDALVALERDDAAASAIGEALEHDGAQGQPSERETWERQLAEIEERHAPNVRGGGSYAFVDGLGVYGLDVGASHDVGTARIVYEATARELSVQDGSLEQPGGATQEADGFVLARFGDPRGVEEIGAGVNFQGDTPLPRATLLGERLLTPRLGATVRLAVDDPIVDTGLLRLAGVQSIGEIGARYEIGSVAYAQLDLHAREDHTRRFHHVANEVGGVAEVGYKLLRAERSEPEWDVGVQALVSERQNVGVLPADIASLIPPTQRGGDLSAYLPPSFQLVSLVTHLTRGDFSERYRPDRAVFPRYDCSAGAGLLLPDLDAAFEAQCSATVRLSRHGYATALGSFEQGVFGVANQTNAETRVSFTHAF